MTPAAPLPTLRVTRDQIVDEAMSWLGTPYHHQASLKGVGCDCLGLVRGVWTALYGVEPEAIPAYAPDWGAGDDTLLAGAARHLVEIPLARLDAGDVLIFRMRLGRPAKHCGIVVIGSDGDYRFLHAWDAAPKVCSTRLDEWWRRRIAAAFAFPGVNP